MVDLEIRNFRILKDVHLLDDSSVSVILGYNESGKSSLAGAVGFVFTGGAFGMKGSGVSGLIRDGESRMKVSIRCGGAEISRTASGGKSLKEVAADMGADPSVLPLLFDMAACADGGGKAMKHFLDSACADALPFSELDCDSDLESFYQKALAAAKDHSPRRVLESVVALRAACKPPQKPIQPSVSEAADSGDLENELALTASLLAKKTGLQEQKRLYGRFLAFLDANEEYMRRVADSGRDALGQRRGDLSSLALEMGHPLERLASLAENAGYQEASSALLHASGLFSAAVDDAKRILMENPAPVGVGKKPLLSPETKAACNFDEPSRAAVNAKIADIDAALDALPKFRDLADIRREISSIHQSKGAWDAYRAACSEFEGQMSAYTADWDAWSHLHECVSVAAEKRRSSVAARILQTASEMADVVLGGRAITLSEEGVFLVAGKPLSALSASAEWRARAAVMASVARSAGCPILVLDGADILDTKNRASFIQFVVTNIARYFSHTIITSTLRGSLADEKPSSIPDVTKWVLTDGYLHPVS